MKHLFKDYLGEIEISELDLVNEDNIFGINPEGHDCFEITRAPESRSYYYNEAQEIEIDLLIRTLHEFKQKGANYVEMLHHPDHHGYVFNFLIMREATQEEIDAHNQKIKNQMAASKQKAIDELERKLAELKKEN